ncbi:PREDICTED: uncharacterized protein LOC106746297 [Dinoponera quadriceps]|uniref:Uncharacterized protein LOC106746297 n=1 Tax=Dinoponera quadriceps TaxID=609295 RepID=A0A6P3XID6_DINQU|nr:PREDICTED: uncharacterized protein LOC106746297 [Dinoponera quadriceps]
MQVSCLRNTGDAVTCALAIYCKSNGRDVIYGSSTVVINFIKRNNCDKHAKCDTSSSAFLSSFEGRPFRKKDPRTRVAQGVLSDLGGNSSSPPLLGYPTTKQQRVGAAYALERDLTDILRPHRGCSSGGCECDVGESGSGRTGSTRGSGCGRMCQAILSSRCLGKRRNNKLRTIAH